MTKSLKAQGHQLSSNEKQIKILNDEPFSTGELPTFESKINEHGHAELKPTGLDIFQVNVGYMCNMTCKHCHVDAGPDRKEIMTRETMKDCLRVMEENNVSTLDLTGGAPEMNPDFRWFVRESKKIGVEEIIVRSNLTIILANKKYHDLPEFFKENGIRVVCSLPFYKPEKTDRQRGKGVFKKSIEALEMLNKVGYGREGSGLMLDLVYNPSGAFLPGSQQQLEKDFKNELLKEYGIEFSNLLTITNLPISRFLDFLLKTDNYEDYMEKLVEAFNPAAVGGVMCRNTLSVSWEGYLYDCDFNQMLDIKVSDEAPQHIRDFDMEALNNRNIMIGQHCYGCTAGAGSSCQGATT